MNASQLAIRNFNRKICKQVLTNPLEVAPCYSGYHYSTTSIKKALLRFCAGLNPARGLLEIHNGEDI